MIKSKGKLAQGFYAFGPSSIATFYVEAPNAALFDAGFAALGPLYQRQISDHMNGSQPKFLFVTHSHFDHCGAVSYLKEAFDGMQIGAAPGAAKIWAKPSAQKLIQDLNNVAAGQVSSSLDYDSSDLIWRSFGVDLALEEDNEIDLGGGISVKVIATPGHTRDHLCYYIPQRGIIIGAEAAGIAAPNGHIFAEFLIDFDTYIDSIKKLILLDAEVFCQGHSFAYVGKQAVKKRLQDAIDSANTFRDEVAGLLKQEDGDQQRVVELIKRSEYDPISGPKQNEMAYLLNTQAKVRCVAELI